MILCCFLNNEGRVFRPFLSEFRSFQSFCFRFSVQFMILLGDNDISLAANEAQYYIRGVHGQSR